MKKQILFIAFVIALCLPAIAKAENHDHSNEEQKLCQGFGPQTPRDISNEDGKNKVIFPEAPKYTKMNLCNIHSHKNAEHKGPGFSVFVDNGEHGGYACNGTSELTEAELVDTFEGKGAYKGVKPGDTIEVHWVHSSCDVSPGEGLGACLSESCANPSLRVETQVFLLVNDEDALNFKDFDYAGVSEKGYHQAKALPKKTGRPIEFLGSTTGPQFTQETCSPLQVTWSVRPRCAKLNIASLHEWAEDSAFKDAQAQGVRQLVTAPELLSPIK